MPNLQLSAKARFWCTFAAALLFLLLPGPQRSFFSGAPLAAKAFVPLFFLVAAGSFAMLFPAVHRPKLRWLAVILVTVALKLLLVSAVIDEGWRATYLTSADWRKNTRSLRVVEFLTQRGFRPYRLDRAISFTTYTFGLDFLNDEPPPSTYEYTPLPRDEQFPLIVRWSGYVSPATAQNLTVSANGNVRIRVADRVVFDRNNPIEAPVVLDLPNGDPSPLIVVEYIKPQRVKPLISVTGFTGRVVPIAVNSPALRRSDQSAMAITILGIAAFFAFAAAWLESYRPLTRDFLHRLVSAPLRVFAVAYFLTYVAYGMVQTIPTRHATTIMHLGDDPLIYEAQSRMIAQRGLLMVDPSGHGRPYYFYPLYSYALAGAHLLMGEDFATVQMFNEICLGAVGFLVLALIGESAGLFAGLTAFVLVAFYSNAYLLFYATNAYSDNLFIVMALALVKMTEVALRKNRRVLYWVTGALTALAAATRPSALLFVPCFGAALIFRRELGSFAQRVWKAVQFGTGFACGVSPFTIRNWIVSRKFILLTSAFITIPYFLFAPGERIPNLSVHGRMPGFMDSMRQAIAIWLARPGHTTWVEMRKVLFTLGLTWYGPQPNYSWYLWIYPVLFAIAVWFRRVPRYLRDAVLIFAISHFIAMVIAAPWTYGYKSILPLHLVFLICGCLLLPRRRERSAAVPEHIRPSLRDAKASVLVLAPVPAESIRPLHSIERVGEILMADPGGAAHFDQSPAGFRTFTAPEGWGAALERGIAEARGDLIVICNPSIGFEPRDIEKLLAYADEFDVICAHRITRRKDRKRTALQRIRQWCAAKYATLPYGLRNVSDVGGGAWLIRRDVTRVFNETYRTTGNELFAALVLEALAGAYEVVQVPVVDRSTTSHAAMDDKRALRTFRLITKHHLRRLRVNRTSHGGTLPDPIRN